MSLLSMFGIQTLEPGITDSFWYGPVVGPTASGVSVNESTAFNYSVCWAATRLLAGTMGWLPFNLYRKRRGGGADIASDHPLHRIIHNVPNYDMSSTMWRSSSVNQQVNWGNCFSEIVRNAGGGVESLIPIHASRIPDNQITRDKSGKLIYLVNEKGGTKTTIPAERMFHVPSIISDDGIIGKGVIRHARESIGKAMATQRFGAATMKNSGMSPFALKNGKFRSKEDREDYRRQFDEIHGGPDKAGKPLLLPAGAEIQQLSFSLEDTQFIETEQFNVEDVARWYGVPLHLLGHLLRMTFNNVEELGIDFVRYHLCLWMKLWEQEVWRKLLNREEQDLYYAKFNVDALERGSKATRTEANVKEFFNGLLTLDQWAEREDMNPIGGEVGAMHFVQQAMVPLEVAARVGKPDDPTESDNVTVTEGSDEPTVVTTSDEAATQGDIQTTALNGAQITAMQTIAQAQADKLMPPEATRAMLYAAFPLVDPGLIDKIVDDIDGWEKPEAAEPVEQPAFPFNEPAEEPEAEEPADNQMSVVLDRLTAIAGQLDRQRAVQSRMSLSQLRETWQRLLSVEVNQAKRAADNPRQFIERLDTFYAKHSVTLTTNIGPLVATYYEAAGIDGDPETVVTELAAKHIEQSRQSLLTAAECKSDELSASVASSVAGWHESRQFELAGA